MGIDIRNTGLLDTFAYADQNPAPYPWITVPMNGPMLIKYESLQGTVFPPDPSSSYWLQDFYYGASIEAWGEQSGSAAITDGWRFGFYTVDSIVQGAPSGYQVLPHNFIGGAAWVIRRIDGGVATQLDVVGHGHGGDGEYALVKRNGGNLEAWHSDIGYTAWELVSSVADSTYVNGPWYVYFGATGVETGWASVGGGLKNRQMIYRWLRGGSY